MAITKLDINMNWKNILTQHGIDVPTRQVEFSIQCPFHDDTTPSLSINIDKGLWICFAGCGKGKLITFLERWLNTSASNLKYLFGEEDHSSELLGFFSEEVEAKEIKLKEVKLPFSKREAPEWIYDRGFTRETAQQWEWGTTYMGSLYIPVRDESCRLVGWICRQPSSKLPKYIYSKGLETSKVLFGLSSLPKYNEFVCLTEGPLDTIWLMQNGISAVALLGSHLSKDQQKLLSRIHVGEIVLCLDNDLTGKSSTIEMDKRISSNFLISQIKLPYGVKDVQDVRDINQLRQIIKDRTLF